MVQNISNNLTFSKRSKIPTSAIKDFVMSLLTTELHGLQMEYHGVFHLSNNIDFKLRVTPLNTVFLRG
jgi:hypothetical protein